jgi:hypothetical protein
MFIIDGVGYLTDLTLRRVVAENDLIAELTKTANLDTGLMPAGTRIMRCLTSGASVWLVERSPRVFLARFQPVMGVVVSTLAIPVVLPWQVYMIKINENMVQHIRCYWSTKPIRSTDDPLARCVMPNMHPTHSPCLGTFNATETGTGLVDQVIQHLMGSSFNTHIDSGNVLTHCPNPIKQTDMTMRIGDTDIPKAEISQPVEYFLRWHAWTNSAANPQIRVCGLDWPTVGKVGAIFEEVTRA